VQAVDDLFASPLHEGDRPQAMPFLPKKPMQLDLGLVRAAPKSARIAK
jgi:hypothetical protein